jgi:hypothetical protein
METSQHGDIRLHDGLHYPVGHLIGVLRNGDEADKAAQSLFAAGYTDIEVLEGPGAREVIESTEAGMHPATRAWERVLLYLSDDADARNAALDALIQGHAIIMVYASSGSHENQAAGILRAHGARRLRYFGRWSVTDLNS